jgi:hypothetical protein
MSLKDVVRIETDLLIANNIDGDLKVEVENDINANIINEPNVNVINTVDIDSLTLNLESTQSIINNKLPNIGVNPSVSSLSVVQASDEIFNTNLTQVNNNVISVNNGNSDVGTLRTVIATDQTEIKQNITQINGNSISVNSGFVDNGCQRVALAITDPAFPINKVQVNSSDMSYANGPTVSNTERICLADNQQFDNYNSLPIINKRNYPFTLHKAFSFEKGGNNGSNFNFCHGNGDDLFVNNAGVFGNFLLPSVNTTMAIVSDNANDVFIGGTGLRSVQIKYYQNPPELLGLQSMNVDLNGITRVALPSDVLRIVSVTATSVGSSNFNIGNIAIVDNATGLIKYPAVMEPYTNRWNSSTVFIPRNVLTSYNNTKVLGNLVYDYLNIISDNDGGDNEEIRIYSSVLGGGVWQILQQFKTNSNINIRGELIDLIIPINAFSFDLIYAYNKNTNFGTLYFAGALGVHIE